MQLFSRNKALAALSLGALAALGACGDDVSVTPPAVAPVAVAISPSNANVSVGGTLTLAVSVTGGTTTPDFTCTASPAAGVITVTKVATGCAVTGVAAGNATVTATAGTASAAAAVSVAAPAPAISGIAISPAAQNLQVGGTFTISANPTNSAPGAAVARNFVSSNTAVATVNATTGVVTAVTPGQTTITVTLTGTGTGLAQAIVTGQVAVTVTALPPSVLGVSATPASAALIVGGTQAITATGTYAAGITGTITYGTSNPGVASVSNAGLISAVGPGQATITVTASSAGNASFAAASATQQIPVTVNSPAQVSIANITRGTTNNPVNINNVAGQIQVQLNLVTNNNNVSSVSLYVCDAGQDCTSGSPAAQQSFGAAGAADGQINLFINTADFTTDFATATAKYLNGQKNLVAVLNVANANANSNLAILNFNNTDGFAAKHTAPTRNAVNATSNTTFFGGPGAEGRGRVQIAPVIYTPARSITRATVGLTGVCVGTLTFGGTGNPVFPVDYTYGYTLGTAVGANATNIVCAAQSVAANEPDVAPRVASSIDNAQNAGPVAANAADFATTTSSMSAVVTPATIRVDYAVPTMTYALTAPTNGELGWVNATYSFATATAADAGVGARAATTFKYYYTGCGITTAAPAAFTTNTGADIAECGSDFTGGLVTAAPAVTRGPYTAWVQGEDLLGNASALTSTSRFGVDKTAPDIRYTASTDDQTIYGGVLNALFPSPLPRNQQNTPAQLRADTMFSAQALDERSGFGATAAQHILARANQLLSTGSCVEGTAPAAGLGASFITAPDCNYGASAFITTLADGYQQLTPVTFRAPNPNGLGGIGINNREGYWTYRARVTDRAGNRSELPNRLAVVSEITPLITGAGVPSRITASGNNVFTPNFSEAVEIRMSALRLTYLDQAAVPLPAVQDAIYSFPAVAVHALWDNIIGPNGNVNASLPFTTGTTFYTNIQSTLADNTLPVAVTPVAASMRPMQADLLVGSVGGNLSQWWPTPLLDANIDRDPASWSSAAASTKGALVQTFGIVANTGTTFFSPAGGIKARVVASSNVLSSPFSRVDYYYRVNCAAVLGDPWQYVGSVDATQAPATSAVPGANVYIADNGGSRVWTYVLRQSANTSTSLTQFVLGTTTGAGANAVTTSAIPATLPNGGYQAIATSGSNGRVLASQTFCVGAI